MAAFHDCTRDFGADLQSAQPRVLAVVAFLELARNALGQPNRLACASRILQESPVSIFQVTRNRRMRVLNGRDLSLTICSDVVVCATCTLTSRVGEFDWQFAGTRAHFGEDSRARMAIK